MADKSIRELQNVIFQLTVKGSDCVSLKLKDVDISFGMIHSGNAKTSPANALFNLSYPLIIGEKFTETTESVSDAFFDFEMKRNMSTSQSAFVNGTDLDSSQDVARIRKKSSNSNIDSEGSPLKLQPIADLSNSAFSAMQVSDSPNCPVSRTYIYKGALPVKSVGTLICSAYAMLFSDLRQNTNNNFQMGKNCVLPSLLIYGDGTDRKKTACMYVEPVKDKYDKSKNYIGIKTLSILVKNPTPNDDHLPKIQNLKFETKEITCCSCYDILGGVKDDKAPTGYRGSLLVEVEWDKKAQYVTLLQQPPLEGRTTIHASVISGDIRSAAYVLYKELELLKSFILGLSTGEVQWLAERGDKSVMESLKALVEHLKLGDSGMLVQSKEECNEELSAIVNYLVIDERKDLDFIDHLWKVLMHCSSYNELVECFQYVFKVLISGELQPFIRSNNNSTFAQLVIESYTGKLRMPNLAGTYALELLAELGSEKLHQDYEFVFLSKDLAAHSNLKPFLPKDCQMSEKIEGLEKAHNVLEMVVMLKLFLSNITHDNLVCICKDMLKHYKENGVLGNHTFTFSLPTSSVKNIIETFPPCSWKLQAIKQVNNIPEIMTIHLVTKQPFPHLETNQTLDFNKTVKDSEEDTKYYYVKCEEKVLIYT